MLKLISLHIIIKLCDIKWNIASGHYIMKYQVVCCLCVGMSFYNWQSRWNDRVYVDKAVDSITVSSCLGPANTVAGITCRYNLIKSSFKQSRSELLSNFIFTFRIATYSRTRKSRTETTYFANYAY